MSNGIFSKVAALGILLILVVFNPFVFPGLYIDSTASFSFVALTKIFLLMVLNGILLVLWILKVRQSQELSIVSSGVYIPVFLWIISVVSSFIYSGDKLVSLVGINSTLEFSFIESLMLILFFFIVVNNIKLQSEIESITRIVVVGLSICFIYTLVRYSGFWAIEDGLWGYYLNSNSFTPLGHYGSLPVLSLVGTMLGIGLLINDNVKERSKIPFIVDLVGVITSAATYAVTLNLGGARPEYIYLGVGVILLGILGYIIVSGTNVNKVLTSVFGSLAIGMVLGFGFYFGVTKNSAQPTAFPSLSLEATWNVTLDSIKGSLQSGLFGIGQGRFGYAFDLFKNESLALPVKDQNGQAVLTNFTRNAQAPSVEEIRVYQPGSIFLGILQSQGLLGVVSFVAIVAFAIWVMTKKGLENMGIFGVIYFIVFFALTLMSIFARYDFMILFVTWLSLAIFVVSSSYDDPNRRLVIALAGKFTDPKGNLHYLLPLILLIGVGFAIFSTYRIFVGNFYAYKAKAAQVQNDLQGYQKNSDLAFQNYPESDIFIREAVYANSVRLSQLVDEVQRAIEKSPNATDENDVKQKIVEIVNIQQGLGTALRIAQGFRPEEYKNYYMEGLVLSRASEGLGYRLDNQAAQAFQEGLRRNPYHPDSYYQLAKISLRNASSPNDVAAAQNTLAAALRYRPDNFVYLALSADIQKELGNYDNALGIYQVLKNTAENDNANVLLKKLYEELRIETKIEQTKKLKDELQKKQNSTEVKPTSSVTPTPSRKR